MEKLQLMALEAVRREPSLELAAEVLSSYIEELEYKLTEGILDFKKSLDGRIIKPVVTVPEIHLDLQDNEVPELAPQIESEGPVLRGESLDRPSPEDRAAIAKAIFASTFQGRIRDTLLLLSKHPSGLTVDQMILELGIDPSERSKFPLMLHPHMVKGGIRSRRGPSNLNYYLLTYWDSPRPKYWDRQSRMVHTAQNVKPKAVPKVKLGTRTEGMVVALRADGVPFIDIVKDYASDNSIDWKVARPKIMSIINKHRKHIETLQSLPPGQPRFDYLSKWFEGWGTHASATSSA
jgi:hypothetical protein